MHTEPSLPNQNYCSKQSTPGSVVPLAMFNIILVFRDDIKTVENHFSWSGEKKWSWLSREFPGSRILVELCCKCRVKGTKIRRKVLYWPNDKRARGSPAQQKVPQDVFSAVTHKTSVRLFSLAVEILQICKPPLESVCYLSFWRDKLTCGLHRRYSVFLWYFLS